MCNYSMNRNIHTNHVIWISHGNKFMHLLQKLILNYCSLQQETIHTYTHSTILWPSWILFGITWVSWHQKGKTRKLKPIWIYWSKRQWMAVVSAGPYATAPWPRHNHTSIPPLGFLQARCPSCCPTNSIKALKAEMPTWNNDKTEDQAPKNGRKREGIWAHQREEKGIKSTVLTVQKACLSLLDDFLIKLNDWIYSALYFCIHFYSYSYYLNRTVRHIFMFVNNLNSRETSCVTCTGGFRSLNK